MKKSILPWVCAGAVLFLAVALFFFKLGSAPLQDYDEATYAQVTHEIRLSGNWFALTHTGEPYFEKPPLYFWAAAVSEELFGESEFALRLPSAVSGLLLILVTMALAYELAAPTHSKESRLATAALAGAMLLTMAPVIETARQVRIDVPVTFFIMLALYGFVRGTTKSSWYLLFWFAAACALLTKSVLCVFIFAGVVLFAGYYKKWTWLRDARFWWGSVLFVLIIAPWHIYESLRYGFAFWREYIGYTVFSRSERNLFAVSITDRDYIWYLANFAAPWTQLLVLGLVPVVIYWRTWGREARQALQLCVSMLGLVALVFFAAKTKAPTYLIPLYPFAALSIAFALEPWLQWAVRRHDADKKSFGPALFLQYYVAGLLLVSLLVLGFASTIYNAFHFNPYYSQSDELAREEKIIGQDIAQQKNAALYAFNDTNLGSVMLYSGNTHPLALAPIGVEAQSFILLSTPSHEMLSELYPSLATTVVWQGQQIMLLKTPNGN